MKVYVNLILWNDFWSLTVLISYVGFRSRCTCAKYFHPAAVNGDVTCTAFVSFELLIKYRAPFPVLQ